MAFLAICVILFLGAQSTPTIFSLNGQWTAQNANRTVSVPAQVPGEIHTDLWRAGKIADPYYRFNDVAYAWIPQDSWSFTKTFTADSSLASSKHVSLVATGLDTVATVFLNGQTIGKTDNQFRTYIFNISSILVAGSNTIIISFESAIAYGQYKSTECSIDIPPDCPPDVQQGYCHVNFLRKEPCSFSWDWGPAFATQGIWKDIYIEAFNDAAITAVQVYTIPNGNLWNLDVNVHINSANSVSGTLSLNLQPLYSRFGPTRGVGALANLTIPITLKSGGNQQKININSLNVMSWWPNGYGDPNLYPLDVILSVNGFASSTFSVRVGFRTIALVQDPLPGGKSFYFSINKVPIFVKGANWIPADAFESRVTQDVLQDQLVSCRDANMNTLRVWGGGIYQQDEFYNLADELGLMIWQEFIFACALYPTDNEFLNSVAAEVKDQLLRLQWHPAIILWSGNNENEAALAQDWYGITNDTLYYGMYDELTFYTVLPNASLYDASRPMLPSSPSNGDESAANPIAANPQDEHYGDVHYYNYEADCWDVTTFPRPRFASEFGFQSYPSFISMQAVSDGSQGDWAWESNFTLHRQHHDGGNDQIMTQVKYHYPLPSSTNATKLYRDQLWISQVMGAQCIKTESEHYRRIRNECNSTTTGCTMGTLYWQANDIWQGASWASLEYGGRWKVLQYFTKKFYSSVLASMYIATPNVGLYLVNDMTIPVSGMVNFQMYSWDNLTPLNTWSMPFSQPAANSSMIYTAPLTTVLSQGKCPAATQCVLVYQAVHTNGTLLSDNYLFLSNFQDVTNVKDPAFQVSSVQKVSGDPEYVQTFQINFSGQAPAPFVWFETTQQGHFSDNAFVYTGKQSSVLFYTRDSTIDATNITSTLTVSSLWDITK